MLNSWSVNGVFSSNETANVIVKIDDNFLTKDEAGFDIKFDEKGRSYITVDQPKMYSLLILPIYDERIITLLPQKKNISIFAFTFGSYEEGF